MPSVHAFTQLVAFLKMTDFHFYKIHTFWGVVVKIKQDVPLVSGNLGNFFFFLEDRFEE